MWFLTCVFPGAGDPPEQVATGFEAGRVRPRPVRRFPLLLHHDRVQRLHVCQPPHVYGGVEHSGMPRIWKPQGFHSNPQFSFSTITRTYQQTVLLLLLCTLFFVILLSQI